ncbi:MAG: hypothetical protein WCI74_04100 [Actinomycetes bacterium]
MQDGSSKGKGRLRWVVWSAIAVVFLLLLGLRVANIIGPKPCSSCHDRADFLAQTQASPHAKIACRSCHVAPGTVGSIAFVLRQPLHVLTPARHNANRDAAAVPDARCRLCHEEALKGVVASSEIRVNHASCAVNASCSDCHSDVAHGTATEWARSYDMEGCLACHVAAGRVGCGLCHVDGRKSGTTASVSLAKPHSPNWMNTHGMGDGTTCTACHKPSDCATCHGDGVPHEPKFMGVHAAYAALPKARCSTCHAETFCRDCHGLKMPHPVGFTLGHGDASAADPDLCKRCHAESDCKNCHVKHVHPGASINASGSLLSVPK